MTRLGALVCSTFLAVLVPSCGSSSDSKQQSGTGGQPAGGGGAPSGGGGSAGSGNGASTGGAAGAGAGSGSTGGSAGASSGGAPSGGGNSALPIWWADADTNGMAAWHGTQAPPGGATIEDDPDGKYGKVYRTTLNTGDTAPDGSSRCELYGTELENGKRLDYYEGDDYFFGWRSRISPGIFTLSSGNSGNFVQLKGDSSCGGPAVGLTMVDGKLTLRTELYGVFWVGPAMSSLTGAWHDIVVHVRFSKNAAIGFVEAWFDGAQQKFVDGSQLYKVATMCPDDQYVYLKMGYYRGSHTEYPSGTHWFEFPRLGTSYAAVAPK